jgi:serralysin
MPSPFFSSNITNTRLSHDNSIDSLAGGTRWLSSTITYSFPASNSSLYWSSLASGYGSRFGDGEPWRSDFTTLTTADQAAFVKALQQWANVANLNFVPVVETPSAGGRHPRGLYFGPR